MEKCPHVRTIIPGYENTVHELPAIGKSLI
jgi:hypothetical protein